MADPTLYRKGIAATKAISVLDGIEGNLPIYSTYVGRVITTSTFMFRA